MEANRDFTQLLPVTDQELDTMYGSRAAEVKAHKIRVGEVRSDPNQGKDGGLGRGNLIPKRSKRKGARQPTKNTATQGNRLSLGRPGRNETN